MDILNFYNPSTREFIGSRIAQIIPGIGPEYPAHCTRQPLPVTGEHEMACFSADGDAWEVVEDHRGAVYVKATGALVMHEQLGALPDTVTLLPPVDMGKWNETAGAWETDLAQLRASQILLAQAEANARLLAGFEFKGATYPGDARAAAAYANAAMQAMVNKQSEPPVEILFTSFGPVGFTNAGMIALSQTCQAFAADIAQQLAAVSTALESADTVAAVMAINAAEAIH